MYVLIAYDISNNKRRTKVSDFLSGYGSRVNYSVFEVIISKPKFKILISKVEEMTKKEDNIRFYILDKEALKKSFVLNDKKGVFSQDELYF